MSLVTLDRPTARTSTRAARTIRSSAAVSIAQAPTAAPAAAPAEAAPRLRAVPSGTEARGFVLYVGIDELKAASAGTDLGHIVEQLKQLAATLVPTAETYAAVALAPRGAGGRDVDVVRLALQDPAALAKHRQQDETPEPERGGVVIDISRKRVVLDGESAGLTYKEFELLQYLVL
ncbi:MAG TPA: winged helix family transcriptional regulator, partial [Glaciihabitans sp.]|nr:winged helix family transcriptional regulator [Glaciihabitans sp.]